MKHLTLRSFLFGFRNENLRHFRSKRLEIPPTPRTWDVAEMPEKFRLQPMPKTPSFFIQGNVRPPKEVRNIYKMQGEELVHNRLQLEQFGIVAIHGGRIQHKHFEVMRADVNRWLINGQSFAIWRVDAPNQPVTIHGSGKKLGGGKGAIKHYVTPVKAGRVILEVAGNVMWQEVQPWLSKVARKLPFDALAVSQNLLERLDAEEKRLEETNDNPYSFEYLVRNNTFGCRQGLSWRDKLWFGKFIYRDQTHNKKWNTIRQSGYRHKH